MYICIIIIKTKMNKKIKKFKKVVYFDDLKLVEFLKIEAVKQNLPLNTIIINELKKYKNERETSKDNN